MPPPDQTYTQSEVDTLLAQVAKESRREDAAIVEDLHDFHKPEDDPWNKAIAAATDRLLALKKN